MGKKKNDNWTKEQNFWFTLLFPIALVCAFPILLGIILIIVLFLLIIKCFSKKKTKSQIELLREELNNLDSSILDEQYIVVEKNNSQQENKKQRNIKEIKNTYVLDDYQTSLVEKGEYEPYQFEEEELEDDDYYSEDVYLFLFSP